MTDQYMKKLNRLFLFLLAFVMLQVSLYSVARANYLEPLERQDAVLLNFVLIKRFELVTRGYRGFVVQQETIPLKAIKKQLSYEMHKRGHTAKEDKEAFASFTRRNASIRKTPYLELAIPITYTSRKQIERIFAKGFWPEFYKQFPKTNGYIAVSTPGYSSGQNTALVYIERRSGGLAGKGELILLEKKSGKWNVKEVLTGWRS